MLLAVAGQTPAHAAQATTSTVAYTDTTTVRGTPLQTWYEGAWSSNSTHTWATGGAAFEIAFTGESVVLFGRKATTNGTADVYVDDVKIGTANYNGAKSNTIEIFRAEGLAPGAHTLRVVTVGWINHASAVFTATDVVDERDLLGRSVAHYAARAAADYTAASWPGFAGALATAQAAAADPAATDAALTAARSGLEAAAAGLVQISGLREQLERFRTNAPADYTAETWAPFAAAVVAADEVLADPAADAAAVVDAKNGLQDAAAALVPLAGTGAGTIENDRFWLDTDGNPIYSQGGGIFRFGDRYYWYGVRYTGAERYVASPTRTYDAEFEAVTAYSSTNLVDWTFENDIATRDTALHIPASKDVSGTYFSDMETLADSVWIGRLGVAYNERTGKYVLLTQFESPDPTRVTNAGVLFLSGDSPVDDFEYANLQTRMPGVYDNGSGWNQGTGDQTVFTDDDGTDYLVFSYRNGRSRTYVAKISDADSLSVESAVQVFAGAGREGNAMFKLDGQYYIASSDLHGWNTSQTYLIRSLNGQIQGAYSSMYVLPGSERDYSHVTQSGFFLTVHGTEQDTVIYAGDRWAGFAWNGLGFNQWLPLSGTGADVRFNSLSEWELDATTGAWEVGFGNNYVLNPDFAADRIAVTAVTGWTQSTDAASPTTAFVSNPSPGADSSRFALRLGASAAFAGDVHQDVTVPAGVYTLALRANYAGGLDEAKAVVTGADGVEHVLDLAPTLGWADAAISDVVLPAGTVRVAIRAAGTGSALAVDGLSLRQQSVDPALLAERAEQAGGLAEADYRAAEWVEFASALADARAVLASVSTQARIDAAESRLAAAAAALAPALTVLRVDPTSIVVPVGSSFADAGVGVTGVFADGSSRELDSDEYEVVGFGTTQSGAAAATIRADAALAAAGAASVEASLSVSVRPAWSASQVYLAGDEIVFGGTRWVATWWTRAQQPGDAYGPWQQLAVDADGRALWTATRIFTAGDTAILDGVAYRAKWWTRGERPGSTSGPWERIG
ncbi:family 43 glycosylhydrolase [Agromyces seonyuensis]|uniref:Family 43 glycosylhydrolase n=1 Tax=Agromyces seonyuensis TaxID=2662446 RepID=A0A6I4NZ03_9MICO|nr:carbohydrate-binding protein [Agromyces seonyuensis]MWB99508.1 family 43 glycosylhydrolase [Agromyces seonyuensis]